MNARLTGTLAALVLVGCGSAPPNSRQLTQTSPMPAAQPVPGPVKIPPAPSAQEIEDAAKKAAEASEQAAEKAKEAGAAAVEKGKEVGTGAVEKAKEVGGPVIEKAKEVGTGAVEKAKEVGGPVIEKAKEVGAGAVEKAKEVGVGAVEKAKEVALGADVGAVPVAVAFNDQATNRFFDTLKARGPDIAPKLDALRGRIMKLDRVHKMALKSLRWQDQKGLTVSQEVDRIKGWVDDPKTFAADLEPDIGLVEAASVTEAADLANRLPPSIANLHKYSRDADMMIAFIKGLGAPNDDVRTKRDALVDRISRLESAQREALEVEMWNRFNDVTLDDLVTRIQSWTDKPAEFLASATAMLDKVQAMSPLEARAAGLPDNVRAVWDAIGSSRPIAVVSPRR